ncbi:MAG: restriction endonuclease [Thermodesulfobacteriota bacterium]
MTTPKWKEFEIAVAKFVAALDPKASVKHDVKLPDIHTGTPRQRDVWVEAKVCQHFPVNVYISCKREERPLDQQEIDAFNGELISSGAHLGVIYSYSGFSENAIQKAKTLRISCCRLFENEPPDIPDTLFLSRFYCCNPRISLSVIAPLDPCWKIESWNDLFELEFEDGAIQSSLIDKVVESYFVGEKEAVEKVRAGGLFPLNWARLLECADENSKKSIRIIIRGTWNIYEARLDAYLLEGSYNFSSGEFIGTQISPAVDTYSSHPGPGWTLLEETPTSEVVTGLIKGVFIMSGGNAKESLIEKLGPKLLTIEEIDSNLLKTV